MVSDRGGITTSSCSGKALNRRRLRTVDGVACCLLHAARCAQLGVGRRRAEGPASFREAMHASRSARKLGRAAFRARRAPAPYWLVTAQEALKVRPALPTGGALRTVTWPSGIASEPCGAAPRLRPGVASLCAALRCAVCCATCERRAALLFCHRFLATPRRRLTS